MTQKSLNWDESQHPRDALGEFTEKKPPNYSTDNLPKPLAEGAKNRRREIIKARVERGEKIGPHILKEFEGEDWLPKQDSGSVAPSAQRLMFDIDTNKTKKLFEEALVETAKQSKKKKIVEKPAAPSLLEKIEDDLKKMHDESRPLGGQKEFFSRMRDAIDRYASKPSHLNQYNQKQSQRQDSKKSGKGRWVTLHGAHVFIADGKITKGPSHLVGKSEGEVSPKDVRRAVRSKSVAGAWIVEKDPKWKNVRIPSIKFKEWIEADEPEVKIPKSKRGAAIYDSAKKAADDAELPLQDVLRMMPDAHKYLKQERDSREKAKKELRRVSGLTAGSIARMENKYLDHSSLKNWDTTAREFATHHPELGFDPESHDIPAMLWDFIREGVMPYISSFDPKVAELAAIWAKPKKLAAGERMPGDEDDSHANIESRSEEPVPFSRRATIAQKFSRIFQNQQKLHLRSF